MKKQAILTLSLSVLLAGYLTAQTTAATNQGHSLFNMMPNYHVDQYSLKKKEFDAVRFYITDKKNTNGYVESMKEGAVEECTFRFNGEMNNAPSNLQILRNFKNAVAQKGGELVYEDNFYKNTANFKLKQGDDIYWVKIYCDGIGGYTITSVKEDAMKQDIVLNADQIKSGLDAEGKVSFYGIFFDTDKAALKAESAPTRTAIATFLKGNPTIDIYVVGHTDNTGDFTRNTTLSKDRAMAVVTELTTKYGVNKAQVSAQGVGSLAPVAANDSEEGKAKNRRVEIVRK